MSVRAITWAFATECPSALAKLVLLKLADSANDDNECWPSQSRVARDCGLPRETVNRLISVLAKAGLLRIEQRVNGTGKQANRYFLLCDAASHPDVIPRHIPCDPPSHRTVREPYSVPNGTAQDTPPVDFAKDLFDLGVRVFTSRGIPERTARTLIGQGRKNLHDDGRLLAIVLSIDREAPVDPIGYFEAAIKPRPLLQGWGAPGLA